MSKAFAVVIAAAVLVAASAVSLEKVARSLDTDAEFKNRPVNKVVSMLEDMKAEVSKEGEADAEAADTMSCWCDTNVKEKSKSIADAEAKTVSLQATIEEMTAKGSTLSTEIETLQGEVARNTKALDEASAIRGKENGEFQADEANMNTGIDGLANAVQALGKTQSLSQESLMELGAKLRPHMKKAELDQLITIPSKRRAMMSFLQQAPSAGSYAPQSGQIFGILKQMKEGFETNLNEATAEEQKAAATFGDMKASKTQEVQAGTTSIQAKETEMADAGTAKANGETDLKDTQDTLAADSEFLATVQQQCASFEGEYAARSKTRTEELAAIGEVISMLTSDEAHDLFAGTFSASAASFVQVASAASNRRLVAAAEKVREAGRLARNPGLVALSVSMKLADFGAVKEAVEKQIADLAKEQGEEENFQKNCAKELKENSDSTEAKTDEKDATQTKIDDLTMATSNLKDTIATLKAEVAATLVEMKRASEDREKDNQEFQATVAEQRATQMILNKALARLKEFYEKKAAAFAQTAPAKAAKADDEDADMAARVARHRLLGKGISLMQQTPPVQGVAAKPSQGSTGVVLMIEGVIKEAKGLEEEAVSAEQDAQTGYENLVTDSNALIAQKQKGQTDAGMELAEKDEELTGAKGDLKATDADLASLGRIAGTIHGECDFVLKNFDVSQDARKNEIESLKTALAMISGADFR